MLTGRRVSYLVRFAHVSADGRVSYLVRFAHVSADAPDPLRFPADRAAPVGAVHLQQQRTGQLGTALLLAHARRALALALGTRVQREVLAGRVPPLAHHTARVGLDAARACR